jgi:SAM-dependent methyltransferase
MQKDFYAEYFEVEDRHWWFLGRRRILLSLLDRHLPEAPADRRIVDIGCGTGTMLQQLSRYGVAQGADGDPEAIRFCAERGIQDVQLIRLPALPFADAEFDLVTLLDVLEHVDEDLETLQSIHRVLKPGGTLLVAVPAFRFLWGRQDEISLHKRRYVAHEIRELLDRAGFEVIQLSYFNTFLFPFIAAIRVLRPFRPGQEEPKSDFTIRTPRWINSLLTAVFGAESGLLRWVNLPFGVSICAVARKR